MKNTNKNSSTDAANIVVVNGIKSVREYIVQALSDSPNLTVSHSFSNPFEAVSVLGELQVDAVLLDVTNSNDKEWISQIRSVSSSTAVIVWGVPLIEDEVISYAKCGASGYVTSEDAASQMIETVSAALHGELSNPRIAALLNKHIYEIFKSGSASPEPEIRRRLKPATESIRNSAKLTSREVDVVKLIDKGFSNKEIARELYVELSTVKNHVHSILRKLRVSRRIMAAAEYRSLDKNVVEI